MDSKGMDAISASLVEAGLRTLRFEFAYMAERRTGGRKPPPRAERLIPEYVEAVSSLTEDGPLIIGGKSMGGRVASMVADDLFDAGKIHGLLCLGYPFHPPDKPDRLRTGHLVNLRTPTLICQGTRDPFGTVEEVPGYDLADRIRVQWLEDGDHDLRPRKTISGLTMSDNLTTMAMTVREWIETL